MYPPTFTLVFILLHFWSLQVKIQIYFTTYYKVHYFRIHQSIIFMISKRLNSETYSSVYNRNVDIFFSIWRFPVAQFHRYKIVISPCLYYWLFRDQGSTFSRPGLRKVHSMSYRGMNLCSILSLQVHVAPQLKSEWFFERIPPPGIEPRTPVWHASALPTSLLWTDWN